MEKITNKEWQEIVDRVRAQRGRPKKYHLDEFFDGAIYRFVQGEDFDCSSTTFMNIARRQARNAGLYIRFKTDGSEIVMFQTSLTKFPKQSEKKPSRPLYRAAINFVSRREKINQKQLGEFFNLSRRQTRRIVNELIKDGYLDEYDRGKNGYPTRFQLAKTNLTVTTEKKAVKR